MALLAVRLQPPNPGAVPRLKPRREKERKRRYGIAAPMIARGANICPQRRGVPRASSLGNR
jgi:ribosomal protein L32